MEEALDKVLLGERTDKRLRREELERVAIHETGHALVSETLRPGSVGTLTIIPRGKALGFMRPAGEEDRSLYTKKYMERQIAICLGGAVAEEVIYGERSTGAASDLEQAARLARNIIATGLSSLGVVDEEYTPKDRICQEFQKIMDSQVKRVTGIIEERKRPSPAGSRGFTGGRRRSPVPSSGSCWRWIRKRRRRAPRHSSHLSVYTCYR